ncbi:hypothetical protein Tco_1480341 [Tanacetum coccineum]
MRGKDERQYNRNSGYYFPTYSGHYTSSNNTTIEFPRNDYFNPIQPNTKFNYDYEDMELDEEVGYTTDEESVMSEHKAIVHAHVVNTQSFEEELSSEEDLDEWLKIEMEKHMSKQNEKNEEDALIAIMKSIREEYTINNDSFISNFPYQPSLEELNPGSFLLLFTIDNYNSYAMANIDASNNVMPRSIYEYLMLANLGGTMSVKMDYIKQQETLGDVKKYTRNYDAIDPQNEIVGQTSLLLEKGGLTKKWHVCKPAQVFYDDGSGEDCGMWPTCYPDSSFCYGYNDVFGKSEQEML